MKTKQNLSIKHRANLKVEPWVQYNVERFWQSKPVVSRSLKMVSYFVEIHAISVFVWRVAKSGL